jgi:hypothetical protein
VENKILSCAILLNGDSPRDIRLQYGMIERMIGRFESDGTLDNDEFSLIVEEVANNQPVSVKHVRNIILQSKSFLLDGDNWIYNEALDLGYGKVSWEQFTSIFQKDKIISNGNEQSDREKVAIVKGIQWCVHMVQLAQKEDMQGLPAFLRCGKEDSLIGKNVAGTATSDALSLLCNGIIYIKECNIEKEILVTCFEFLVKQTLGCQCKENQWDQGGFFPLEDQPEAEHPTVDATCLAIMALCDFYSNRNSLEESLGIMIEIENHMIEDAVLDGLEFLFRMQQPEGSYGIYRYEQEYPDGFHLNENCHTGFAIPNENCTRMVLSTMGVSKGSGIFDAREWFELYGKCSEVISKAYAYIKSHVAIEGECSVWTPYFGTNVQSYPYEDTIVSSARVCRSLIPVWLQCKDEEKQIKKYHYDFLAFWMKEAENIKGKAGKYTFKTPGKEKYSVGTYTWQGYTEMIAAFSVLQSYNLFEISLKKEEWIFLEEAVRRVLEIQHSHGHWNAPKSSNPFCAATLAAIELLKEYRKAKGLR